MVVIGSAEQNRNYAIHDTHLPKEMPSYFFSQQIWHGRQKAIWRLLPKQNYILEAHIPMDPLHMWGEGSVYKV